jgi:hypothetical protein
MRKISKIPILFYDSYTSYFFLTSVLPETKSAFVTRNIVMFSAKKITALVNRKSVFLKLHKGYLSRILSKLTIGFER